MEIQNLDKRVKVTMENGDVFIGKLVRRSRDADGICSLSMQLDAHRTYLHVFSAESSDTQPIIPSYVDTVELLDDPECERIDDIDDVREGDIFVAKDGNHYPIKHIGDYGLGATFCVSLPYGIRAWLDDSAFSYALRPKPQLPDRDGLWFDKDGALWVARDDKARAICTSKGTWMANGPVDSQLRVFAPFRPAKAVEA
jgi:hypothetical protein